MGWRYESSIVKVANNEERYKFDIYYNDMLATSYLSRFNMGEHTLGASQIILNYIMRITEEPLIRVPLYINHKELESGDEDKVIREIAAFRLKIGK